MSDLAPTVVPSPPILATTCSVCGAHLTKGKHLAGCKNEHWTQITVEPLGSPIVTGTEPRVLKAQPVRVTFADKTTVILNVRAPYSPSMDVEIIERAKDHLAV